MLWAWPILGPLHEIPHVNYFSADLIAYTTGLLITLLLLALTLRASKLPGAPLTNVAFACCALFWNAGGLSQAILLAAGISGQSRYTLASQALQFSGAAAVSIPILDVWRPFAAGEWQKRALRLLYGLACVFTTFSAASLWFNAISKAGTSALAHWEHPAGVGGAIILTIGASIVLRRASAPRAVYIPSLVIVLSVCAGITVMFLGQHIVNANRELALFLFAGGKHVIMLVVLGSFLLFARFRYADVFIRYSVRIVLAGLFAAFLAVGATARLPMLLARHGPSPPALHIFIVMLLAYILLLSFSFVDERISTAVARWLFRPPDFRAATRRYGGKVRELKSAVEIAAATEEEVMATLDVSSARMLALDSVPERWSASVHEGEIVEVDNFELVAPITVAGRTTHILKVLPGPTRPGFVTHDLNFLRTVVTQCGSRLDQLRREQEAVEQQSRENVLLQQVTEAELRALRAQINPHFLFNSLNTIADLIVRDPGGAEAVTLRLASVFRHVLAHTTKPLTSVRDEMDFLRTCLYIEEARFGDRLHVTIEMDPEIAANEIPSLILQPLVENALKHGLGPKPGPGHLWIFARTEREHLCLTVEDDGIGCGSLPPAEGLGLANVAERLKTLYQDRAGLRLEPREGGGTRVRLWIPK